MSNRSLDILIYNSLSKKAQKRVSKIMDGELIRKLYYVTRVTNVSTPTYNTLLKIYRELDV